MTSKPCGRVGSDERATAREPGDDGARADRAGAQPPEAVSDTSQGPGWWQASDGRWYPPEQHPDYQGPTQQVQGPAYEPYAPPTSPPAAYPPQAGAPVESPPSSGGSRAPLFIGLAVAVLLVAGGVAYLLLHSDDSRSTAAFCSKASQLQNSDFSNGPLGDPDQLQTATAQLQAMADAAPDEIRGDMQVLNDVFKDASAAVNSASDESSKLTAVLSAMTKAGVIRTMTALEHVQVFTRDKCHLTFNLTNEGQLGSELSSFSLPSDFSSFSLSFDSSSFESFLSEFSSSIN